MTTHSYYASRDYLKHTLLQIVAILMFFLIGGLTVLATVAFNKPAGVVVGTIVYGLILCGLVWYNKASKK